MLLTAATTVFAQNVTVQGTVSDATNGETLPGVSVVLRGTTRGTITDLDGNYTISVPADAVLSFSSVGFKGVNIDVNGRTVINVHLDPDAEFLLDAKKLLFGLNCEP